MLYGLWDDANDRLVASDENPAVVMDVVRHEIATRGKDAADSLVFVLEDNDEGLHYLASGADLIRMAQTDKTRKDEA